MFRTPVHDFLTVFRSDTLTCLSLFQVTDYLSAKALTSEAISGPTYQVPVLFCFNYSNFNVSWCSVIGILPTVLAIIVSSNKTVSSKVTSVSGTKLLERLRSVQFTFLPVPTPCNLLLRLYAVLPGIEFYFYRV